MKTSRSFLAATILLVAGFVWLFSQFHGDAGLNVGWPSGENWVKIAGQSSGLGAVLAFLVIVIGVIVLLVAAISAIVAEVARKSAANKLDAGAAGPPA